MSMSASERKALTRLRDCGVVRFHFQDDAMSELNARGLAYATYIANRGFCFDWRLTAAGRRVVGNLEL